MEKIVETMMGVESFSMVKKWLFCPGTNLSYSLKGRRIENASEGITLQIEKKEESAGALNAYIYLIMDAQLNIKNGAYISAVY